MTTIINKKFSRKFEVTGENRNVFISAIENENDGLDLVIIDPMNCKKNADYSRPQKGKFPIIPSSIGIENRIWRTEKSILTDVDYVSQTGYTFSGYIISDFPLIEIGTYRVESPTKTRKNIQIQGLNDTVFIYAPIKNQECVLSEYPIIFTYNSQKNKSFVFQLMVWEKELKNLISKLFESPGLDLDQVIIEEFKEEFGNEMKKIEVPYLSQAYYDGEINNNIFEIFSNKKDRNCKGADLALFSSINYAGHISKNYKDLEKEVVSPILKAKKVKILGSEGNFAIIGKYQEIVKIFTPKQEEELYDFLEIKKGKDYEYSWIGQNIFMIQVNHKGNFYEYELQVSLPERLVTNDDWLINKGLEKIALKIVTDEQNKELKEKEKSFFIELLEKNKEKEISVQDSYDVGNCEFGTSQFIDKYFRDFQHLIDEGKSIPVIEFLNSGELVLSEILDNEQFKRVLLDKFVKKEEV